MSQELNLRDSQSRSLVTVLLGATLLFAHTEVMSKERQFTPEQLIQTINSTVQTSAQAFELESSGAAEDKSIANGLYMQGTVSYSASGGSATLSVERINNDSYSATTGTLRLELWASTNKPSRGVGFTGYRLAASSTLSPLPPRTFYSSVTKSAAYAPPPDGTYWMVLVLSEYSSSSCASNNNYCVTDSWIFSNQRTFGSPSTSVTLVAPSAGLCIENVPSAVATSLQQSQPGVWTTYPESMTCSSRGYSLFAGNLPSAQELRVYTTSSNTAQQLCGAALVVNCTSYPAPAGDYTDLWWNPNESGWGVSFTQHSSGIAFVAWYTYDSAGNPKWYVASNCRVIGAGCTGALYETSGPPFGSTFDPSRVTAREIGSITFTFSNSSSGSMSYTVNGVSGTKAITRQPF